MRLILYEYHYKCGQLRGGGGSVQQIQVQGPTHCATNMNRLCFLSNRQALKLSFLNVVQPSGDLDQHLNDLQLAKISKLGTQWETKAYLLGLSEVEIEDIKQDNQSNEMRRVAMLRKWASKFGDKATLRTLIEVSVDNDWITFIRSVCSCLGYIDDNNSGHGKYVF